VDDPIEVATGHACLLGSLTSELAERASAAVHGPALAAEASAALGRLLADDEFYRCCLPVYLALAPVVFEREVQLPIAGAEVARLDTRVLLWPIGAKDGHHPHRDGWAAVALARGRLCVSEERDGSRLPERPLHEGQAELLFPEDNVSHHIHNRGNTVGVTIHIFGE
jgi:hypothetical protein